MKILGSLIAFALALLVAGASGAAVTTARSQPGAWVVSFVNGDTADSAAIDNSCATWRVSFDLGGGSAAATIYGVTSSTDATSAGVALTNGTLTAASLAAPVVVSTALPYIKVDVVTGPSSGTARVWLFCTQSAGGGGGESVDFGAFGYDINEDGEVAVLTSLNDTTNDQTGAVPVDGLSFDVAALQEWDIFCHVPASAVTNLTGIRLGFSCPLGSIDFVVWSWIGATALLSGGPATSCPQTHATTSSQGVTPRIFSLRATGAAGATPGTVAVILSSETVGSAVTAHAGGWCQYRLL